MKLKFEVEDGGDVIESAPMAYMDWDGNFCICDCGADDALRFTEDGVVLTRSFDEHWAGWNPATCTDLTGKTLKITFGGEA